MSLNKNWLDLTWEEIIFKDSLFIYLLLVFTGKWLRPSARFALGSLHVIIGQYSYWILMRFWSVFTKKAAEPRRLFKDETI